MEYIAPIAAFLIAALGISGNTWDRKKSGLIKFTPTGWVISALALITFVASLALTFNAKEEKK